MRRYIAHNAIWGYSVISLRQHLVNRCLMLGMLVF